jgi:hypothetical protein
MKVTGIRFGTTQRGGMVALGAPPSGADESHLWQLEGDVVRGAAAFVLAAASAGDRIRVTAELQASPPPATRIWIGATPHDPHVLGPISDVAVRPSQWRNGRCKVTFELDARALGAGGVDQYPVTWRWHARSAAGADPEDLGLSEHLLFVIVSAPTAPWSRSSTSTGPRTAPWPGALAQACDWARGVSSHREAAARVLESLFALGELHNGRRRLKYNADMETYVSAGMANPRWFDCEGFLDDVADETTDLTINCYEGAVIAMTFANLLGCRLVPCAIEADCEKGFALNRTRPLGLTTSEGPSEFVFHVVALDRIGNSGRADDLVYDAVIRIDADRDPAHAPTTFAIVDGVRLGKTSTKAGRGKYYPQLIAFDSIHRCKARTMERPWVGVQPVQESVDRCPLVRYVSYLWAVQGSESPQAPVSPSPMLRIEGYDAREIFSGRPGVPRKRLPPPPFTSRLLFTSNDPGAGRTVRVDSWTHDDPWVTVSFAAELLAMSEIPVEPVRVRGGTAFSVARRTRLLVLEQGALVRLTSVGAQPIDMVELYERAVSVAPPVRQPPPIAREAEPEPTREREPEPVSQSGPKPEPGSGRTRGRSE